MTPRTWENLTHMGIFPHANSQVKRTLPSRVMAETIFAGPTTFCFFMSFGPTTHRANYSETTLWGLKEHLLNRKGHVLAVVRRLRRYA